MIWIQDDSSNTKNPAGLPFCWQCFFDQPHNIGMKKILTFEEKNDFFLSTALFQGSHVE